MKRIKYISQFSRDLSRDEVAELARRAAETNATLDLTGILMSSGRIFFQVLEGPDAHVDQIFARIVADDRHRDVLLLESESDVRERFFPDWSMRKFDLDANATERLAPVRETLVEIARLRQEIGRLTPQLERAVLRELAGKG